MSRNMRRDTQPERALRSSLHQRGLRFRVDYQLRLVDLNVRPDIVFTRWNVAVFVDGCFWHRCPEHGNTPARNRRYWVPKLNRNVVRDRRIDKALDAAGWTVVRAWEHEEPDLVVNRVLDALAEAGRPAWRSTPRGHTHSPTRD